jgi:hypothetical protein
MRRQVEIQLRTTQPEHILEFREGSFMKKRLALMIVLLLGIGTTALADPWWGSCDFGGGRPICHEN